MFTRRAALAGGGAAMLVGCAASHRPLWSADTHAADYPTVRAVEHMAQRIKARTGGRYDIKVYPGGQLGSENDTLEMTMFGGLDLNRVNLAPLNPIVPETIVPALPFVFRDVAHMRAAMDGAPGRRILDAMRPHGLVGLCFYDSGARSVYNTRGPIETPGDMAGLKIRVQNSDLYVAMVEALGANATPMSFGEVYQALVQGVIDGAENNWPSYDTTRHFEAAPHYALTQHVMAPEALVISARRWAMIPKADHAIFRQAAAESVSVMRRLWDATVEASKAKLVSSGVMLSEIPDKSAFQDRMAPVYDRFVTPALRPLVEEIRAVGMGSA
ncbi:MAG: TRAP transporter substrate-binding protein [Erythrobacter sp.]|jgi:tripartite ATP-independent transporter DctP family solute receptor|nr:TRAP transporter substrate-binding protein [Erythrobacter sp.]